MATRFAVIANKARRFIDPSQSSTLPGIKEHFDSKPRWLFGSLDARIQLAQSKFAMYTFVAIMLAIRFSGWPFKNKPEVPLEHQEEYEKMYGTPFMRKVKDINPFKVRFSEI